MAVLSFRPVESNPWPRGHFWAANPQHLALFMCFLSCKNTQYISIEQKVLFLEYLQFYTVQRRLQRSDLPVLIRAISSNSLQNTTICTTHKRKEKKLLLSHLTNSKKKKKNTQLSFAMVGHFDCSLSSGLESHAVNGLTMLSAK